MDVFKAEFYDMQGLHLMPDIQIAWRLTIDGLHSGSHSVIKRFQSVLQLYGTGIVIDGKCGPKTREAQSGVIDYLDDQYRRHGLSGEVARQAAIMDICSQAKGMQFAHYHKICSNDQSQVKWWKGWLNRIRFEPQWYRGDVLNLHRSLMVT